MDIPKNIGWKRLFLTGSQKFILDLSRLGSKDKPDKVESFIIFLEGLTPSSLWFKAKRDGLKAILQLYWAVAPKRLQVYKTKHPFIVEYLPWFKKGKFDRYLTRYDGYKKVHVNSIVRTENKRGYTYSWKKAYYMTIELKKQVEQEELQWKLDYELKKMKGEEQW
jgi:hypothetical protein